MTRQQIAALWISIFLSALLISTELFAQTPAVKKQINKIPVKTISPNTLKMPLKQEVPDNDHLPDLLVERFELVPKYAILGEPYKINIWFKQYRRLPKTLWVQAVKENIFAPALLKTTRKYPIPTQWRERAPEIVIEVPAEQIVDMKVQQKKRLTLTLDSNNDLEEKSENNNQVSWQYGLYPANTRMADLMCYDHKIYNRSSESKYYFKSESPKYQKRVNQQVKIWGYIINMGDAVARPFKIRIKGDDDRDQNSKFTKILHIGKQIRPKEVYTFHTYLTWPTPGLKVLLFELDIEDTVIESNEGNNQSKGTCTLRIAQ